MSDQITDRTESRMKTVIESLKREFNSVRTGRANPGLLERVMVDYHGVPTPLTRLASISAPEPRMLVVQPWDKGIAKEIEKAILKSELGLTPNSDGNVIRLMIPSLTEERRRELVRAVRKIAEEKRVNIRNLRRDANDEIKSSQKQGEISEDEAKRLLDKIQQVTDKFITEIDRLLAAKENEIMEV